MPSAQIQLDTSQPEVPDSGFPTTLKTPYGTALVEIQGAIQIADRPLLASDLDLTTDEHDMQSDWPEVLELGELDFSLLESKGEVLLQIGANQRLRGKIQKLPKALAVMIVDEKESNMTVKDIVRYKMVFTTRPEPTMCSK